MRYQMISTHENPISSTTAGHTPSQRGTGRSSDSEPRPPTAMKARSSQR
ncbi:MAG: hypothetical protein M5U09_11430 [Gammaproteobacteria bacterium]|nr:hypothetical protein [Gammaproteobacteria bacterium]